MLNADTFHIQTDAVMGPAIAQNNATFENQGLLTKNGEVGQSTLMGHINLINQGTVAVETGTLALFSAVSTGGVFTVAPGATLEFFSGSPVFDATSEVSGGGRILVVSGAPDFRGTYDVALTEIASSGVAAGTAKFNGADAALTDTLCLTRGTISGTGVIEARVFNWAVDGNGSTIMTDAGITRVIDRDGRNAVLDIRGPDKSMTSGRRLENFGTATWTGAGNLNMTSGTSILNAGEFIIQTDALAGDLISQGDASFENEGVLRTTGSQGATVFGHINLLTQGTVSVETGTLQLTASEFIQTAGQTTVASGATIATDGDLELQGGELVGPCTIVGTHANFDSVVNNSGAVVAPGGHATAGQITLQDVGFVQSAGGTLIAEIGGRESGNGHDRIVVNSGVGVLGGTLEIDLIDGFENEIQPGDCFELVFADMGVTGCFDTVIAEIEGFSMSYEGEQFDTQFAVALYQTTPDCRADVSGPNGTPDGTVGISDLLAVLTGWGTPTPDVGPACSGIVDILDFLRVLAAWGDCATDTCP